jgi:hypothetical protein
VTHRPEDVDPRWVVVVPALPGPPVRLDQIDRPGRAPDEVDALIDEVFGPSEHRRASAVDVVLLVGGVAAVGASVVWSLSGIVVIAGVIAALLGCVLPVRSAGRRFGRSRRQRQVRSLVGDGSPLRIDHAATAALLAAHDRLVESASHLTSIPRSRVQGVAHAALREVATLLGGDVPTTTDEIAAIEVRIRALADLDGAVCRPDTGDGELDRRRAMVGARREVEDLAGSSSVTDAADLSRELLGPQG